MNASTSPLIHIETLNLLIPSASASTPEPPRFSDIIPEAPAEYTDWEKWVWRRGHEAGIAIGGGTAETREYQQLGGGEKISQQQALDEVAKLGNGWRLETPNELHAQVDYSHKNQHGALSRDETLKPFWYWTDQEQPGVPGARVVVGFSLGIVGYDNDYFRAFARAVRVSGQ